MVHSDAETAANDGSVTLASKPFRKVFPHVPENGDFSAYHAAEAWLRERGFSYGSMQRGAPTAIYRGDCDVSKWRNLDEDDLSEIAGTIVGVGGRFREGPVTVTLFGCSEEPQIVDRTNESTDATSA